MQNKTFYTVEIEYDGKDMTIGLFRITNLDGPHLQRFRENVFMGGAYRRIDDATGEVIPPHRIRNIMIYKQDHFFNPAEEDRPLVKSEPKKK